MRFLMYRVYKIIIIIKKANPIYNTYIAHKTRKQYTNCCNARRSDIVKLLFEKFAIFFWNYKHWTISHFNFIVGIAMR